MVQAEMETGYGQFSSWMVTATLGAAVAALALRTMARPRGFPPGPKGLPFVGIIFAINERPDIIFKRWQEQYGDIFSFKAGERWFVVVNKKDLIKEAMIKQDIVFANRPKFYSIEILTEGFKNIVFGSYSDTWKFHRKLGHTALRHFATGKHLDRLLQGIFPKYRKALDVSASSGPVDPKGMIILLLYNMLSAMCFGTNYDFDDPRLTSWRDLMESASETFGMGLAADFFSFARYIPTKGPQMIKDLGDQIRANVEPEVERHKKYFNPDKMDDFIDLLLLAQKEAIDENSPDLVKLSDTHLIQTVMDIFAAGITTSTDTLYWAIALMTVHQEVQTKAREEIDDVVARDRDPVISDRGKLPYTEAVLYEVMRYSSILPTAVPHATLKDTKLGGYAIPKDTIVLFNIHSMHYDPAEWEEPESFRPEHFLDDGGKVRQHPPSFLPFGAGRRSCLGEAVAKADLFLFFVWMLQNFTFSRVPGTEDEDLLQIRPTGPNSRNLLPYRVIIKPRE